MKFTTDYVPKYYVRLTVTVKSGDRVYYVGGEVKMPGRQHLRRRHHRHQGHPIRRRLHRFCQPRQSLAHPRQHRPAHQGELRQALENPAKDPPVYPGDQINVERRIF